MRGYHIEALPANCELLQRLGAHGRGGWPASTLRYGGTTPPLTMDPHATNDFVTASLVRQVYDSLVGLDDTMELEAGHSDSLDAAGREHVALQIRPDVTFHDGRR